MDIGDDARRGVRPHSIPIGHIPGSVPASPNAEIVQDKETLSRRLRHSRDSVSPNVFDGDCHAGVVLLFCDYRNGNVCRIRYAELLQVSMQKKSIVTSLTIELHFFSFQLF